MTNTALPNDVPPNYTAVENHFMDGFVFQTSTPDNYLNVTELLRSSNSPKKISDYRRGVGKLLLEALVPLDENLIDEETLGIVWFHPQLALHFTCWCDRYMGCAYWRALVNLNSTDSCSIIPPPPLEVKQPQKKRKVLDPPAESGNAQRKLPATRSEENSEVAFLRAQIEFLNKDKRQQVFVSEERVIMSYLMSPEISGDEVLSTLYKKRLMAHVECGMASIGSGNVANTSSGNVKSTGSVNDRSNRMPRTCESIYDVRT